jgi:single-stranded-DNA-specific exonuclease
MISKRWTLKNVNHEKTNNLQQELQLKHQKICQILVQRGLESSKTASEFFNPILEKLHDPFLMKGMQKAVERIEIARAQGEKILIYGDYDVDGTTSVALMYSFLREFDLNIDFYIPDRYLEGYGVSLKGIDYAAENQFSLIIALDCGVTAIEQVAYAKNAGVDFIICDHHLPSETIPDAVAVLDPKQEDCPYPFKELSGCGVGFKLCQALCMHWDCSKENVYQLLDLVAVSIASDIVPIVGENRILAYFGLKKLNENPNNGLKSLIEWANLEEKNITISDVVFSLGPRINAPGRMAHAKASVEILISEDPSIGRKMAESLNLVNDKRRATDELMTSEALESIALDLNIGDKKTIVLHHPDWHKGVVGIVASRLVEKFYRPTIIFSETDGVLTGSARSIKGYSIYQGIKSCEHLVNQFGGHDFAAGVSMPKENFEEFVKTFEQEASKIITNDMLIPEIEIDAELLFSEVTMPFFNILNRMAPFGPHNMQPVFITKNLNDAGGTKIVGKNHIRFHLKDDTGKTFNGICFGLADWYQIDDIKRNPIDICYTIQENHYNGKVTLDLMIKDIKIID